MTPRKKAEELIDKFHIKVYVSFVENSIPSVVNALMLYDSAKQCALLAVDELLNEYPAQCPENSYEMERHLFWKEVKQEIENL